MDSIASKRYYVYALYRPGHEDPFYIGKGCGARIQHHEWCARREETCRHRTCRVIRKVWREGGQITRSKLHENLSEEEAHEIEVKLIAYGRENGWSLVNQTNGGEGISGYKGDTHPPSQREKHRQRLQEYYASSPELIERQRQISENYWETHPEEREQYRLKMADPVTRAKCGEANIGNTYNAKNYTEGFKSPSGEVFTEIHNLKAFCDEHELNSAHMCNVYNGTRISHNGWTRYPVLPRETKPTYAKAGFKDPNGNIYEANAIPNLAAFCREHGLNRVCMVSLGDGTLHSYKGWTRYPEIKAERDYHGTYTGPSLRSPEGTVYTTEEIDNLTAFCREHGLQTSNMSLVAQGKQRAHKGWTKYNPD